MSATRKTSLSVKYAGKDATEQIKECLSSFTYTDMASGSSDEISLVLEDREKQWIGGWMPRKGDCISAAITFHNWEDGGGKERLYCGKFEVDELSFSGRPLQCMVGAVSAPQGSAFNSTERTKTWEKATIKEIASDIAKRAGASLHFEAGNFTIGSIEQSGQTDCKFLYGLCQEYGLAMKVFSSKIVIFDEEKYENKKPVATLKESDMLSWEYTASVAGTYTGAKISFTDPANDEEYAVMLGSGKRILNLNVTAESMKDAERKGTALLNEKNKQAVEMAISAMPNPAIVAGACIQVKGLGKLSGKYYVDKVKIKIAGNNACQMELSTHLVTGRIKTKSEKASKSAADGGVAAYTIKAGDTLWALAKKYLGSGIRYKELYSLNAGILEAAAKERGKNGSDSGNLIFPGTVIQIPKEG